MGTERNEETVNRIIDLCNLLLKNLDNSRTLENKAE